LVGLDRVKQTNNKEKKRKEKKRKEKKRKEKKETSGSGGRRITPTIDG